MRKHFKIQTYSIGVEINFKYMRLDALLPVTFYPIFSGIPFI